MAFIDETYHRILSSIINVGYEYKDNNRDIMCTQISSTTLPINIREEFPLITTKKMFTKGIVAELIWFLRGLTTINYLKQNGVSIWDKDAYNWYKKHYQKQFPDSPQNMFSFEEWESFFDKGGSNQIDMIHGNVGANYGYQWRKWTQPDDEPTYDELFDLNNLDQISKLLEDMVTKPMNRRNIITAWNPADLHLTALPPCHWAFEVIVNPTPYEEKLKMYSGEKYTHNFLEELHREYLDSRDRVVKGQLDSILKDTTQWDFVLKWHQRSVDSFLGLPFNIASYALLGHIISLLTGYRFAFLIGDLSNVHIYENHIDAVNEQLRNNPAQHKGCQLQFSDKLKASALDFRNKKINFDAFINSMEVEDVEFIEYESYPAIKAEMVAPK